MQIPVEECEVNRSSGKQYISKMIMMVSVYGCEVPDKCRKDEFPNEGSVQGMRCLALSKAGRLWTSLSRVVLSIDSVTIGRRMSIDAESVRFLGGQGGSLLLMHLPGVAEGHEDGVGVVEVVVYDIH